ncbi:MAG: hypothetical protein ACR2NZ_12595, partial [Rubripirellula sp.]
CDRDRGGCATRGELAVTKVGGNAPLLRSCDRVGAAGSSCCSRGGGWESARLSQPNKAMVLAGEQVLWDIHQWVKPSSWIRFTVGSFIMMAESTIPSASAVWASQRRTS